MNRAFVFSVVIAAIATAWHPVSAQDLTVYRAYALDSSLGTVVAASGTRLGDAKTLHTRPANIQELEWRAPYVGSGTQQADPVRSITFTFLNDALYRIVVRYDRERTEGLTNEDIVASLSSAYGSPRPASATPDASRLEEVMIDAKVVARWDGATSSVTLVRGVYSPEMHLVVVSKPLSALARAAIREAGRLDTAEAPRRELEQRKKEVADAATALDKTREANKAAFRP